MQQQKVREDEFQAAGQKLGKWKQKYQQYIAEQEKELEIKKQEIQQHIAEMDQKLENKKQGLQPHISRVESEKSGTSGSRGRTGRRSAQKNGHSWKQQSPCEIRKQKTEIRNQTEAAIEEIQQKINADKQLLTDKKEEYSWQCKEQKHVDKELRNWKKVLESRFWRYEEIRKIWKNSTSPSQKNRFWKADGSSIRAGQ